MKFKNIIQNLGANLLITLLGLVGSIILARWLGPSQRGVFAAIILIPTILQYFVNFGLSSATIYFTAQPNSDKNTIWSNLIFIGFIQSITGILIGYFIINFYLQKYGLAIVNLGYLYLFTVPLGLFGMYATYMLQGASHFKVTNLLKCIVPMGYCIGIIWLKIQINLSIKNLVYVQLIIQSLYLIIAVFFLYKTLLNQFIFKIEYKSIHQMIKYGIKVWFGDIAQLANSRIDQFLIGGILSSRDLGIYTVAISVAKFTSVFADAVSTVMLPSIIGKNSFQHKVLEMLNFFKKYWLFSVFFHGIFALMLPILIPFVFGNAYSESIIICQILVIGSFFVNAKTVLSGGVLSMGFPEIMSYVEAFGMITSLIFSGLMINFYGLIGVSIAVAFSYIFQFIGLIFLMNYKGINYKNLLYTSRNELQENVNWLKTATNYFK
jgi:O-antigen/teichoic acid export membrane protein